MIAGVSIAQQLRQSNMYGFNKYGLNPAYAGISGCTEVNFSHLNQWVKVDGAPMTNFLSANTRLGQNWGIGGEMTLDRAGLTRQFSTTIGGAYGVTIAKDHHLRFGLSGGMIQIQVDPNDAVYFDFGDELVESGIQSAYAVNTAAGLVYRFKGLELSFASQQLLETRANAGYPTLTGYELKRHLRGYASYDVLIGKSYVLRPSVMYKGVGTLNQFDINLDLNYDDFLYGGLGYRTSVGLIGRIGVNVRKLFFIGYAYEIPMQNIASYGSGSHEIALGLKFCKKEKEEIVDPIASTPVRDTVTLTDTITVVEHVSDTVFVGNGSDTVFVNRVDTVFVEKESVSNEQFKEVMTLAAQSLEFEYDKAIITEHSHASLLALVNLMTIRKDIKISLEGHTDSQGTEQYNMRLSKDRVEAVKAFLVSNGIDAARVDAKYYGESKPIADNRTEEGRRQNRRVVMEVVE